MVTNYTHHRVEIRDEIFVTAGGRKCQGSAIITFFGADGEELSSVSLGVIETAEVYKMISEGRELVLDDLYITEFSLSDYRESHGLGKKESVRLTNFSARNSFFESHSETDFSYSIFNGGNVDFSSARFLKGEVIFAGSDFGKGSVIFTNSLFHNGNLDFSGSLFGDGDFLFKNVVVHDGIKNFQDIKFGNGEITFANTEFNSGEILFINTHFGNGKFNFKVARVTGGKIDFHYSIFGEGEVSFERAEFGSSRVDFRAVDFGSGRINFNRTIFGTGEISFEGASCKHGKIQFKKAEMGVGYKNFSLMEMSSTEVSFDRTVFGIGDVTFLNSRFRLLSLKGCHLNHYFDLRLSGGEILDISDTIVRDIIDLKPFDFDVKIKIINFSGMRRIGKLYLDWKLNNLPAIISAQDNTTVRQKSEQFRILKQDFSDTGRYDDEDKAYVLFKRYEAKANLFDAIARKKLASLWAYPVYGFKWLVFDRIGLYATSPGRVLLSVSIFWFLFGFLYFLLHLTGLGRTVSTVGNPDNLSILIQSFYHSAITFFTIGYGDVYPTGLSRLFSGIEGFMGVFMMSYFTVAFVRRVLR